MEGQADLRQQYKSKDPGNEELKSAFAGSVLTTVTPDNTGHGDTGVHDNQLSEDGAVQQQKRTGSYVDSLTKVEVPTIHEGKEEALQEDGHRQSETISDAAADLTDAGEGEYTPYNRRLIEGRQHHLLRHSLPTEQRGSSVLSHFGVETVSDAAKQIKKMSQRDLQAKFRAVYGTKTFSNNNNWLRRKLFEAIGMDPGKSTTKKAGAGGQRRRRTPKATVPKAPSRYSRRTRLDMDEDHQCVAEALLALADIANMSSRDLDTETALQEGGCSDGMVPVGQEISDGGASWSDRGEQNVAYARDVPVPVKVEHPHLRGEKQNVVLPSAVPLNDSNQFGDLAASMMEYYANMQRYITPEAQQAMMMAMMGQQTSPTQQQIQYLQQAQQAQYLAMAMAFQQNPSLAHSLMSQSYMQMQMSPDAYARFVQEFMGATQMGGAGAGLEGNDFSFHVADTAIKGSRA